MRDVTIREMMHDAMISIDWFVPRKRIYKSPVIRCELIKFTLVSVIAILLISPVSASGYFVSATSSVSEAAPGSDIKIVGTAAGEISSVYVWIFGPNYQSYENKVQVNSDNSFEYHLTQDITQNFNAGDYFVLVQIPEQGYQYPHVTYNSICKVNCPSWDNFNTLKAPDKAEAVLLTLNGAKDQYTKLNFRIDYNAPIYTVRPTAQPTPIYTTQKPTSLSSKAQVSYSSNNDSGSIPPLLIIIVPIIALCGIIGILYYKKRSATASTKEASIPPTVETPHQHYQAPAPTDSLQPFLPHINRLIQSQPKPLESLEKFYAFLELEGFTLTPEIKTAIEKKIRESRDDQERSKKKQQISAELFGGSSGTTSSPASAQQVVPLSTVPPGSTCQVCLSEFSSAEPGAVKCPYCNNLFHYRCIAKWINKNGTCPVCKKELKA